MAIRIRHLFISPGHNYFGHHGQAPGEHPAIEVASIHCLPGRGIEGDRFFDYKPGYKGQVTFFAWEEYERLSRLLGVPDRAPSVFRRNIITEGVDLNGWIGQEFELGGVRFRGRSECAPCYWMDQAFAPGAEAALKGRGGLRAEILTEGYVNSEAEVAAAQAD